MKAFIKGLFTDTLGRPEPKMVLGIPLVIGTTIYTIITSNIAVGGFLMGAALVLIGATATTDALNDKRGV